MRFRLLCIALLIVAVSAMRITGHDGLDVDPRGAVNVDSLATSSPFDLGATGVVSHEFTPSSGGHHWSPNTPDYISCYISWGPGANGLSFLWAHNRVSGEPFFTGLNEVIYSDPVFIPTRFSPQSVQELRGTNSLIVEGRTVRGEVIVERWNFGDPSLDIDSLVPGTLVSREDLLEMDVSGQAGLGLSVLYNVANEDPVTGYGEPTTLLVKPDGVTNLLSLSLTSPTGTPSELAGPGPVVFTQDGPQPQFLIPSFGLKSFSPYSPELSLSLGQVCILRNESSPEEVVIVIDSNQDGVPDNVAESPVASLEALGVMNDGGVATDLDKGYYRKY